MSNKTACLLSVILSLLLFAIFAVLAVIFEIIALNGASESQGTAAVVISLACLGAGAVLIGVLAWKFTSLMISNLHWNPALAVTLTVALGFVVGGTISLLSILVSIPLAGIQ